MCKEIETCNYFLINSRNVCRIYEQCKEDKIIIADHLQTIYKKIKGKRIINSCIVMIICNLTLNYSYLVNWSNSRLCAGNLNVATTDRTHFTTLSTKGSILETTTSSSIGNIKDISNSNPLSYMKY